MGIRISKDHLHPSVIESITSLIGDLDQLETTAKGNAVEAINELLANGGNKEELEALIAEIAEGKELIANAVGEPVSSEDTFQDMSNDINGLLATFKTNMMNNGIAVESGDRFKSLIDKIATLADNYNKLQFVTGTAIGKELYLDTNGIEVELNFKPDIVVVYHTPDKLAGMVYNRFLSETQYVTTSNNGGLWWTLNSSSYVNETGFKLVTSCGVGTTNTYYAIGVGEEDTTLRDSLASILEEEGVSVTEEDDMASLISKVDEEFDRKNNPTVSIGDNILMTTYTNSTSASWSKTMDDKIIAKFTSPFKGAFRVQVSNIRFSQSSYDGDAGDVVSLKFAINGSVKKNVSSITATNQTFYYDFNNVNVGDLITVYYASATNVTATVYFSNECVIKGN